MAKAESRGISWEGQILEVWDPHRDPEQIILSSFPNFPSYYWGCTALVPPRIRHWEAGDAEGLVPVLSIDSVATLFKIQIKRNQGDSNVLEQGLSPLSAAFPVSSTVLPEAPVLNTGLPCEAVHIQTHAL